MICITDNNYTISTQVNDYTYFGPNNWEYVPFIIYSTPYTEQLTQMIIDKNIHIESYNMSDIVSAKTINGRKPTTDLIEYVIQKYNYPISDNLISMAIYSNNIHIAQYLISQYSDKHQFETRINMYAYFNTPRIVTAEDIEQLYIIYGNQLEGVLKVFSLAGDDDDDSAFRAIIGKVSSNYFNNLDLDKYIKMDNIRCISVVYQQSNIQSEIIDMLTDDQHQRLLHYL